MLQKVDVGRWSLDAYEGIAPEPIVRELREHVREHFLLPRRLMEELRLLRSLVQQG